MAVADVVKLVVVKTASIIDLGKMLQFLFIVPPQTEAVILLLSSNHKLQSLFNFVFLKLSILSFGVLFNLSLNNTL